MIILLTNDDGIDAEGIQKLAEVLRSRPEHRVYVIAPDANRSGVSHAISILNAPVKLTAAGADTWSCSGFPGDCVIIGMKGGLPERPDLVLSGINRGENLGTDIIYSGTAAAARQASLHGVPALAISLAGRGGNDFCWDMAASWSADHLEELLAYWRKETFVNVNIPNNAAGPEGIAAAWPAVKDYRDVLTWANDPEGSRFFSLAAGEELILSERGCDCEVVSRNYVSVSTIYNYPAVAREFCPNLPVIASVGGAMP
ncbi:MAG: 5'/3'-nucleotidase SurE [Treponema sp.]|jgi:5'-nucleotidase|nr:5'/3'-nucleotidase SurE [Treponema sp.]